jgi:hypothetical protein
MLMKQVLFAAAVFVLLSGCGESGSAAADSGIKGKTVLSPTCPVEHPDRSCPEAGIVAQIEVRRATDSSTVAETTSGADGSFTLDLPAGDYVVVAEVSGGVPTPQTQRVPVTVQPQRFGEIVITFDSGIRGPASRLE